MARIPEEFDEADAAWFTEVLGVDDTVTAVSWSRIGIGVGLLGRLARFQLDWADGRGPGSLVLKLPSAIPEMVVQAQMFGFYEREVNFYRHQHEMSSVRTPHCWHVDAGPEIVPFVIVLEDLVTCRVADQLDGCSLPDGLRVARAAAALHAPLWGSPELHELGWLPEVNGPLNLSAQPVLQATVGAYTERWAPVIGDEACALAAAVADSLNDLQHRAAAEGPLTVVHHDFRLDNLLFDDAGDDVAVLDFQLVATQRGPYDLAYFLGFSMTPDQRRAHGTAVLDEYHRALLDHGIDVERLWIDQVHRESTLFVVAMGIASSITAVTEDARGDALLEALVVRGAAAAADVDAGAVLAGRA